MMFDWSSYVSSAAICFVLLSLSREIQKRRRIGNSGDALKVVANCSRQWNSAGDEFSRFREFMPPSSPRLESQPTAEAFEQVHPQDFIAEQVEAERAMLAHIVDSSEEDAILRISLEGKILSWTRRAEAMYGYTSEEAIGRSFSMLSPPDLANATNSMMKQLVCGSTLRNATTEHIGKGHNRIPVVLTASPLRDRNGNLISICVTARDDTERKRTEMALCQAERLSDAGRMAASIAHEINDSVSTVLNALYLLGQQPLTEKAGSYLVIADRQARRVADIARQALGLVRESAMPVRVDVRKIFDDVVCLCQAKIHKNRVQVVRKYHGSVELIGFPGVLRQIFSNLAINAVEAMEQGGQLTLHITRAHDAGKNWHGVRVFVSDTGSGINPAHQKRIFEPLYTSKEKNGAGLGLWVTQRLVAKHAGSMRMRSCTRLGKSGTCFAVFLPDCKATSAQSSVEQVA